MRRLLCWLFGHKRLSGQDERYRVASFWPCARCGELIPRREWIDR